jgi:hypothetical protein
MNKICKKVEYFIFLLIVMLLNIIPLKIVNAIVLDPEPFNVQRLPEKPFTYKDLLNNQTGIIILISILVFISILIYLTIRFFKRKNKKPVA